MTADQGKTPRVDAALEGWIGNRKPAGNVLEIVARDLELELSAALVRAETAERTAAEFEGYEKTVSDLWDRTRNQVLDGIRTANALKHAINNGAAPETLLPMLDRLINALPLARETKLSEQEHPK